MSSSSLQTETVIFVTRLTRAKRFYNQLFQCPPEHTDNLCGTAQYSLPHGFVTLKADRNRRAEPCETKLCIPVDDFLYEYQRLQLLGIGQLGRVTENLHGETRMTITDGDGNILTVVGWCY